MTEMTLSTTDRTSEHEGMSLDDFQIAYDEQPFELIDGERIPIVSRSAIHSDVIQRLNRALMRHLLPQEPEPVEFFIETTFVLTDGAEWLKGSRQPDLMVYERERITAFRQSPGYGDGPFRIVPDWVIEVVSPTDLIREVNRKRRQYLADGVRLVWVIEPYSRELMTYTPDEIRLHTEDDRVHAAPVLPDLALTLREVLPPLPDPTED